jgi:hypothetical protein
MAGVMGFAECEAESAAGRVAHLEVREETDQDDDGERNSEQEQENRAHYFSPLNVVLLPR